MTRRDEFVGWCLVGLSENRVLPKPIWFIIIKFLLKIFKGQFIWDTTFSDANSEANFPNISNCSLGFISNFQDPSFLPTVGQLATPHSWNPAKSKQPKVLTRLKFWRKKNFVEKLTQPGYDIHRASHGINMALIEIDGLPSYKMVMFHGELLNKQRVIVIILTVDGCEILHQLVNGFSHYPIIYSAS